MDPRQTLPIEQRGWTSEQRGAASVSGASRNRVLPKIPLQGGHWPVNPPVNQNRRRSPRTRVSCTVQLRPIDGCGTDADQGGHRCVSLDMSAGGMRLRSARPYPVDARALISFECEEDGVRQVTSCLASVVWTDSAPRDGHWQMGVRFGDGQSPIALALARGCICNNGAAGEPPRQDEGDATDGWATDPKTDGPTLQ